MAKQCHECGGKLKSERLDEYVDKLLIPGGPVVVIVNGVDQFTCEKCGEKSIRISNPDGVTAAVAMELIAKPRKLTGPEIKFLRKALGMTARQFAEVLLVDHTTVSKWENTRRDIGARTERFLRMFAFAKLTKGEASTTIDAEDVAMIKRATARRMPKRIEVTRGSPRGPWRAENAAA